MGEHAPWWVALAVAGVAGIAAAAQRVWSGQRDEIKQLRGELQEAHEQHQRDLRRLGGLSTSMEPPATSRPRPPPVPPRKPR